jgi:hypothetical protein
MESRLESCLERLVKYLDRVEDETPQMQELANTIVYIGEQVEMLRIAMEQLCKDIEGIKRAKKEKPRTLF